MSNKFDELYKKLHKQEPTWREMLEYGWALKELADGVTDRNLWEVMNHVSKAERYLSEFRGKVILTPELTEQEANLSAALHTYMRKGMDCPLGTMLYHLICENKGTSVWYAFVKGVHSQRQQKNCRPHWAYNNGIKEALNTYHLGNDTSDNLMMLSVLQMWNEDFPNALSWATGDDHEGEAGTA